MTITQSPPPPVPNHNKPTSELTKLESVTATLMAGVLASTAKASELDLSRCRRIAMEILK